MMTDDNKSGYSEQMMEEPDLDLYLDEAEAYAEAIIAEDDQDLQRIGRKLCSRIREARSAIGSGDAEETARTMLAIFRSEKQFGLIFGRKEDGHPNPTEDAYETASIDAFMGVTHQLAGQEYSGQWARGNTKRAADKKHDKGFRKVKARAIELYRAGTWRSRRQAVHRLEPQLREEAKGLGLKPAPSFTGTIENWLTDYDKGRG